jgi:hypothetical protein
LNADEEPIAAGKVFYLAFQALLGAKKDKNLPYGK